MSCLLRMEKLETLLRTFSTTDLSANVLPLHGPGSLKCSYPTTSS